MKKNLKNLTVIFIILMAMSIFTGCSKGKARIIILEVNNKSFTSIENAAPASEYVFYINEDDQQKLANGDLNKFSIVTCTGDKSVNRAVQIGVALGISQVGYDKDDQTAVDNVLNKHNNIVVTKRDIVPSVKATEVVFKIKQ